MAEDFSSFLSSTVGGKGAKAPPIDGVKSTESLLSDFDKKSGETVSAMKAVEEKYKGPLQKNIDESHATLEKIRGMKSPDAPTLKDLPDSPDTQPKDPIQALGSMASILAMLGSLRTRAPLTSALNAGAASMQGFHQGDKERVKLERDKFHDELEKGLRQNQEEMAKYSAALQKSSFDMTKAHGELTALASQFKDEQMLAAMESGNVEMQYKIFTDRASIQQKLTENLLRDKERMAQISATAQAHEDALEDRRLAREQKMEKDAEKASDKAANAEKPARRAVEVIGEMEGILQTEFGVTGAARYARMPYESVKSMFTGESGKAHQYESLARELQNILRQTEEFRYKGRTLAKEVADRDAIVRGLQFGDTGEISLDQLNHVRNMLTGQGAGFEGDGKAALPPDESLTMDDHVFPDQKSLDAYKAAKAGAR
jgi:hypothetical protein